MTSSNFSWAPRGARPWTTMFQWAAILSSGCTWHHSKQALSLEPPSEARAPAAEAHFVTEEDSGLSIFGMFMLAEPDHYAVLLERMRRDHRCGRLLYPQLDFYTDHWLLIAFPISRVTSLCEPEPPAASKPAASQPAELMPVIPAQGSAPPPSAPAASDSR